MPKVSKVRKSEDRRSAKSRKAGMMEWWNDGRTKRLNTGDRGQYKIADS
jgi:hypothetical protein